MFRHVGLMQTGSPSNSAPYVAPKSGESSWYVGLTQVGRIALDTSRAIFTCTGTMRTLGLFVIPVTGIKTYAWRCVFAINAYVYHTSQYWYYIVQGASASLYRNIMSINGTLQRQVFGYIQINGAISLGKIFVIKVTGICGALYTNICKITGTLRQYAYNRISTTGILRANKIFKYRVRAMLSQSELTRFVISGTLGKGSRIIYKVTAGIREQFKQRFKLTGVIANTTGRWFIKITGKLNVATFVTSLPKKTQDFISTKTWFK